MGEIIGTQDFIQYWSAFQVALAGGNPYDPQAIFAVQKLLNPGAQFPIMMWNPPWILLLLSPILALPFEQARLVWIICNLFFFSGSIALFQRILISNAAGSLGNSSRWLLFGSTMFYPCIDCVGSGQLGNLLLFIVVLAFTAFHKRKNLVVGILLALLSVKANLFLPFGTVILLYSIRTKRLSLIASMLVSFVLLGISSQIVFTNIVSEWFQSLTNPSSIQGAPTILTWRFATIPGVLRGLCFDLTGHTANYLMVVIPALALIFAVKHFKDVESPQAFAGLLTLSVAFAPYGWLSDFALLLPTFLVLLFRSLQAQNIKVTVALVISQPILIVLSGFKLSIHGYVILFYATLSLL